ncbi:1-acyl-sn-glycerol-3-phosphate acyltransferase [Cellulophaga baltica]|uniref:lysophospholipid acyltransferase family protein n=1 Tax=Cellulophaga TaxID=104264 RepID=UPI001C069961|nr:MULTISPECIES: lysophospholipid acyltransferase family protein [Cellulophaga]MBU2995927.1 1-acyl-sn-glycerol-3-phosphate acyltransferase [Cellulophaga baltica]MDO6767322.1 lysophospholipid acyltransferase family protein [Cellulophaga sp. 1_MG-2023]
MIKFLQKIGSALYQIWFYILVAIPILILWPLLILFTISEKGYPYFFWIARNIWANFIIYGMGCIPVVKREERIKKGESYMLVANHTSMLDIMLMLKLSRNPFVFVGKKELSKIPVFGFFYKRVSILVDRSDPKSRTAVYRSAQKRLKDGFSICIFPEGGVPDEDIVLDQFKDGAFRMAIAHKISIVPMTFHDNKARLPFTFTEGKPGRTRATIHRFFKTDDLNEVNKASLKEEIRTVILTELKN